MGSANSRWLGGCWPNSQVLGLGLTGTFLSYVYNTFKLINDQIHTHICKWHTITVYYKHDMSGRRKFAAEIRDFQYSLYSGQELLYVKFSPDNPPLVFGQKLPKGGLSGANRTDRIMFHEIISETSECHDQ